MKRFVQLVMLSLLAPFLNACDGDGGSATVTKSTAMAYTISGSLSGVGLGVTLTLLDNGGDTLTAAANGRFQFSTALANGARYNVTVDTQPKGQKCTVVNGAGIVDSANVTNIQVSCIDWPFSSIDPVADAKKALDDIPLSSSDPAFVGTQPMPGTDELASAMGAGESAAMRQAFALASSAKDPEPRWWATQLTPQSQMMKPGQTINVQVNKIDSAGTAYAGVEPTELNVKVAWQGADGTITPNEGSATWTGTGELQVTTPANLGPGRLLVALRPNSTDPAILADTQRWSALFTGEEWGLQSGTIDLSSVGRVLYPGTGHGSPTQFTASDMLSALKVFQSATSTENVLGYPVVISGVAAIFRGASVDLRLQGYPVGGTVYSVETRGDEQMLIVQLDPAAAYVIPPYNPQTLINAGLLPQNPIWTASVGALSTASAHLAGAGVTGGLTAQSAPVGAQGANIFGGDCTGSADGSLTVLFEPVWDINNWDVGLFISPKIYGSSKVSCTWEADAKTGGAGMLKAIFSGPLVLLFGTGFAPEPYGEIEASLDVDGNQDDGFSVIAGYSTGQGGKCRVVPLSNPFTSLNGTAITVTPSITGEVGVKSEISEGISGGAVGMILDALKGLGASSSFAMSAKAYINDGAEASLPNGAAVYQTSEGSSIKVAAKAGVLATIPSFIAKLISNPRGEFDANVTLTEVGLDESFQASAESQSTHSAKISQLVSAPPGPTAATWGANGGAKAIGKMGPKDMSLSFFDQDVGQGDTISATEQECQKMGGTLNAPIVAEIASTFYGLSNEINICSPISARIDATVASAQVGHSAHATVTGAIYVAQNPPPPSIFYGGNGDPLHWYDFKPITDSTTTISEEATADCSSPGVFPGKNTLHVDGLDQPVTSANILTCTKNSPWQFGDPHIVLSGGQGYDFQATGDFTMLQSADQTQVVQAHFDKIPGTQGTAATRLAVKVGGDTLEISTDYWFPESGAMNNLVITLNGQPLVHGAYRSGITTTPFRSPNNPTGPITNYVLPGGGVLTALSSGVYWADPNNAYPTDILISWPESSNAAAGSPVMGLVISINQTDYTQPRWLNFYPVTTDTQAGTLGGLLGNGSTTGYASLVLPNGQPLLANPGDPLTFTDIYAELGPEWAVQPGGACLFAEGCSAPALPSSPVMLTADQLALGEQACASLPEGYLKQACITDVGLTGDSSLAQAPAYQTLPGGTVSDPLLPIPDPTTTNPSPSITLTMSPSIFHVQSNTSKTVTLTLQTDQMAGYLLLPTSMPPGSSLFLDGVPLSSNGVTGTLAGNQVSKHSLTLSCGSQEGEGYLYATPIEPVTMTAQLNGLTSLRLVCASDTRFSTSGGSVFALDGQGRLWDWGNNGYSGILGNGTTSISSDQPALVQFPASLGSSTIVSVDSSGFPSIFALDSQGRLWGWGLNQRGELGNGTASTSYRPGLVLFPAGLGSSTIVGFESFAETTYALDSQGRVWAWGDNTIGQLGDGTTTGSLRPELVAFPASSGSSTIVNVDSYYSGQTSVYALDSLGRLWAWGYNYYGQLGDGANTDSYRPELVAFPASLGTSTIDSFASNGSSTYALDSQGRLWAWGDNANGQLGDGTTTDSYQPELVAFPASLGSGTIVKVIVPHSSRIYALDSRGRLWAWGSNKDGQLGDGTTTDSYQPELVAFPASLGGSTIVNVYSNQDAAYALDSQGRLWAWGANSHGQLGDGMISDSAQPSLVQFPTSFGSGSTLGVFLDAKNPYSHYAFSIDSQGRVWGWGDNGSGQMGNGSTGTENPIPGLVDQTQMGAVYP